MKKSILFTGLLLLSFLFSCSIEDEIANIEENFSVQNDTSNVYLSKAEYNGYIYKKVIVSWIDSTESNNKIKKYIQYIQKEKLP